MKVTTHGRAISATIIACSIITAACFTMLFSSAENSLAVLVLPLASLVTIRLLKRKSWISFAFLAINTLFALIVFLKMFAAGYEADAWRADFYDEKSAKTAFLLTLCFLFVASLSLFVFSRAQCELKIFSSDRVGARNIFSLCGIALLLAFLLIDYKYLPLGKFAYGPLASGIPFLELATILAYITILDFKNISSSIVGKAFVLLLFFCMASIFLFGFRGVVLGCLIVFVCKISEYKKVKVSPLAIYGVLAFSAFVVIGVVRSELSMNYANIMGMLGKHEENEFYTLLLSVANPDILEKNSYLGSIGRLVGLGGATVSSTFAMDILPDEVTSVGANMGMYFMSEAFLNFGFVGSLVFAAVVCFAISLIEAMSSRSVFARCAAIMLLAQSYTLAYYGSSNFVSMAIQGGIIIYLYSVYSRIRFYKASGQTTQDAA
ncbi:hypothetical protein [Pseudomonas sp. LRF_L74]|uniref:hypothetical protein n=1 Tax=Pseudomonas sp. LRF_L74 TaxID=3369422 RepID=UPI003F6382E0